MGEARTPSILLCLGLLSCAEAHLAHGLGSEPSATAAPAPERHRAGCRLNVATHAATCPCAFAEDIDQLPDRPDLETLDLELDEGVDPAGLDRLTHLRGLRVRNATDTQLVRVTLLPRLESLTVNAREGVDLSQLAYLKNLRSLSIGGNAHACDLTPLAALTKLEKLVLALSCEHGLDVAPLAALPALREVILHGVSESNDAPSKLPNAKVVLTPRSLCDIDPAACPTASSCK